MPHRYLADVWKALSPRSWVSDAEPTPIGRTSMTEPTPAMAFREDPMPEPTLIEDCSPISERPEVRRAPARIRAELRDDRHGLENPPARIHAEALLSMIRHDVEPGDGPILYGAMTELYVELLI